MELDPCLPPVNISNITCLFRAGRRDFPSVTSERERERRECNCSPSRCVTKPWCQPHADYLSCYIKCSPVVPVACRVVCILLHKALSCTTMCRAKVFCVLCYHAPHLQSSNALCFHACFCPHRKSHLMIKTKQEYFSINCAFAVTL